jgi:hypothetical protein
VRTLPMARMVQGAPTLVRLLAVWAAARYLAVVNEYAFWGLLIPIPVFLLVRFWLSKCEDYTDFARQNVLIVSAATACAATLWFMLTNIWNTSGVVLNLLVLPLAFAASAMFVVRGPSKIKADFYAGERTPILTTMGMLLPALKLLPLVMS